MSWNVNGVCTKLEKGNVHQLLCGYDIIAINEVKTQLPVNLSGYKLYRSDVVGSAARGGTVVLVKNWLSESVFGVDTSKGDQVWMQMRNIPGVLFGFCYIPPSDSQYYSLSAFSYIKEKLSEFMPKGHIIIGDMNARFGKNVKDLLAPLNVSNSDELSYPFVADDINVPNDNAQLLSAICVENSMLVMNNLKTEQKHFLGNKTFRRRDAWISEVDVCMASCTMIRYIDDFSVVQRVDLPSDHAPITLTVSGTGMDLDNLIDRTRQLGDHAALYSVSVKKNLFRRPLKFMNIDKEVFSNVISQKDLNFFNGNVEISEVESGITNALYSCVQQSVCRNQRSEQVDMQLGRWERLLSDRGDSRVWKAINWKGEYASENNGNSCPSSDEFKAYFETILNADTVNDDDVEVTTDVTIPVLDEQISVAEVQQQIKRMHPDKSCGPDGLPPGVFSLLPAQWVLAIVTLFNNVFLFGSYPCSWIKAKVFTIFKKGDRHNPHNYRGISILNSLAKLFDMVLCERLSHWFRPLREQAGAQRGRGCIEHIVTLRLLVDTARRKKEKLFVMFVDFSKAYDLIPRNKLLTVLKRLGCGMVMLGALTAMYRVTQSVVGSALFTATLGVRQGSPTSCILFIIYINELVKMIKEQCMPERFLDWLHVLVLMDDTVLLSTSRANLIKKVEILDQFCRDYGMYVNNAKTSFFVIHGDDGDADAIHVNSLVIEHCHSYIYLGSPFTSDGSVSSAVKAHSTAKLCHVLKYVSFVTKNNDLPFIVKRRVFEAALMSAILYGCESWVSADYKPVTKLYNWALKQMLGVRKTTPNIVCYAEVGLPSVSDLIKVKQHKFFRNIWLERSGMNDDPLILAIRVTLASRTPTSRNIDTFINTEPLSMSTIIENVCNDIAHSDSSRCKTYKEINPQFKVPDLYKQKHLVNDLHRISFTRFRLCGHRLAIETGRWNRRGRGRLPVEERLCSCGGIQTERHAVEVCPLTAHLRHIYNVTVLEDIFADTFPRESMCKMLHEVLNVLE
uniref:Reverse transcriptase domain-containing protein n=1 Tax=Scylla olivacea TaxID=85551 RepID=A0A0P4VRG8_SCYOL